MTELETAFEETGVQLDRIIDALNRAKGPFPIGIGYTVELKNGGQVMASYPVETIITDMQLIPEYGLYSITYTAKRTDNDYPITYIYAGYNSGQSYIFVNQGPDYNITFDFDGRTISNLASVSSGESIVIKNLRFL